MAESAKHEQLVALLRGRAELTQELLAAQGITFKGELASIQTGNDLTQAKPLLSRADLVQVVRGPRRVEAVLVGEVQLTIKHSKRLRWPLYCATARVLYRCKTALVVVIAPDPEVARWAAQPIQLGGESVFQPIVLGPDQIPRPSSPDDPIERVLLGLSAHPDLDAAKIAVEATGKLPEDDRPEYNDVVRSLLAEDVWKEIESMVSTSKVRYPVSDFAKEHYGRGRSDGLDEGLLKGQRELLLQLLAHRFGDVPAAFFERVHSAEFEKLAEWSKRILDAETLEQVFAED